MSAEHALNRSSDLIMVLKGKKWPPEATFNSGGHACPPPPAGVFREREGRAITSGGLPPEVRCPPRAQGQVKMVLSQLDSKPKEGCGKNATSGGCDRPYHQRSSARRHPNRLPPCGLRCTTSGAPRGCGG